jgi:hypothetical protein
VDLTEWTGINGFAANGRVWVTPARRLLLLEKRDVTTLRPGPRAAVGCRSNIWRPDAALVAFSFQ